MGNLILEPDAREIASPESDSKYSDHMEGALVIDKATKGCARRHTENEVVRGEVGVRLVRLVSLECLVFLDLGINIAFLASRGFAGLDKYSLPLSADPKKV